MLSFKKIRIISGILFAAMLVPLAMASAPCLQPGESTCVKFEIGDRSGKIIVLGKAKESDPGPDDDMGDCSVNYDSSSKKWVVSACVVNDGGTLKGPNGKGQTGGGEGDCITVYIEVTIYSSGSTSSGGALSTSQGGAAVAVSGTGLVKTVLTSTTYEICKC